MRLEQVVVGAGIAIGLLASKASAQEAVVHDAVVNADSADAISGIEGYGYSVTPGWVVHPSIGIEGGATDNVFYQSANPTSAAMLKAVGGLYIATDKITPADTSDQGDGASEPTPRAYEFRGGFQAGYIEYPSGNNAVSSQSDLSLNAGENLVVFPASQFSFLVNDAFVRDIRPPNYEDSSSTNRDDNQLMLGLRYQPYGHAFSATLRYVNWVDVFEASGESFANRMNHTIGLTGEWQWLPYTKLMADVSYGFYGALGNSVVDGMPYKTSSQPLRAIVGFSSLLTLQTTLKAHIGYAQASYGAGEGYVAPVGGAELGYRWSDNGRFVAAYDYDHFDSFNANFYRDHAFSLKAVQQVGALVLDAGPELRFRQYGGIPTAIGAADRNDVVVGVRARAQYVFAEKYTAFAQYLLSDVQTNYLAKAVTDTGMTTGTYDPSYVRNELMVGVRAAY